MTLWIPHPFPETRQPWEPPPVSSSRVLNHVYLQMFTGAVTAEGPFQAVTLILLEERCTKIISSCQTFRTMKQKQMWHYNPWVLNPTTVPFFFCVLTILCLCSAWNKHVTNIWLFWSGCSLWTRTALDVKNLRKKSKIKPYCVPSAYDKSGTPCLQQHTVISAWMKNKGYSS